MKWTKTHTKITKKIFRQKMTIDALIQHEEVVGALVKRLHASKKYYSILVHFEYFANGRQGEADVVALSEKATHYYEVKGKYHPNNYERALCQFKHFKQTNPVIPIKFIYVSSNKVERVRI